MGKGHRQQSAFGAFLFRPFVGRFFFILFSQAGKTKSPKDAQLSESETSEESNEHFDQEEAYYPEEVRPIFAEVEEPSKSKESEESESEGII